MAHVVGVRAGPVLEHDLARLRDARQVLQVPQLVDARVTEGSETTSARDGYESWLLLVTEYVMCNQYYSYE